MTLPRRPGRIDRTPGPSAPRLGGAPGTRPVFTDWADEKLLRVQSARRRGMEAEPDPPAARQRRRLALGGAALLALAGLLLGLRTAWPSLCAEADRRLALRTISVEGGGRISSAELAETTGLVRGTSLLDVDPRAAEARLLAHPWVSGARVMRLPPGRVLVTVSLREPIAWIQPDESAPARLVDAGGLAFEVAQEADLVALPRLVPTVVATPDGVAPPLADGVAAAQALGRAGLARGAEVHLAAPGDPDGVSLRLPRVPGRVVLGSGGYGEKLAQLESLLAAGVPGTQTAAAIDLRFQDRAVLRSPPPPDGAANSAGAPGGARPPHDRSG